MKHSHLKKFYSLERTIGTGGFAKVKLATHLLTGEKVAVKIINKESLKTDTNRVSLEISSMKTLSHKNICQLFQVLETETHFYLVTEYCAGGELFDHIVEREHLDEDSARVFFKQIVSAVAYLHSQGYAHRDIKPENILLDKDGIIKLIDFGLCAQPGNNMLLTSCGSPTYAAPELIRGTEYLGASADIWSLGVVLYAIVVGKLPFDDETFENLYLKIQNGVYGDPAWLSPECRELIRGLLQVDPQKRFTIEDICNSKWMQEGQPVEIQKSERQNITYHAECLELMAQYKVLTIEALWELLVKHAYDYDTATYLILCKMYENNQPLRINVFERRNRLEEMFCPVKKSPGIIPSVLCNFEDIEHMSQAASEELQLSNICYNSKVIQNSPINNLSPSAPLLDNKNDQINYVFRKHTRINEMAAAQIRNATISSRQKRRKSINGPTQENRRPPSLACSPDPNTCRLPTNFNLQHGKSTPRSSPARRMLGSIERSMHRVRRALMPRRSHLGGTPKTARTNPWTPNSAEAVKIMPQVLNAKNLSNVSTTTAVDPALVLLKLRTALYEKGIFCKQKGYTLRGRMELCKEPKPSLSNLVKTPITTANDEQKPFIHNSNSNSSNEVPNSKDSNCYCSFELEVCLLDTAALGGGDSRVLVRRKRLKGDAWCYKKVCEEVLRITSTEFLDDESFLGVTRFDGNDSY